jgi:endonuclease YncB( thermonuclease family)
MARTVASCFKGAEDLNRGMVANGWAVAYRKYSLDYVANEERVRRRQTRAEKWKRKYGWLGGTLAALWLTSRGFG